MADLTTAADFTGTENVDAIRAGQAVPDATVAAVGGVATFTGLRPNTNYTLVGQTSAKRIQVFTGEGTYQAARLVSVVFDAASVAAATAAVQNITTPSGTVNAGDVVVFVGRSGTSGAVGCTVGPIVTPDTIPVLFNNGSAGAIDLASQTYNFLVYKPA